MTATLDSETGVVDLSGPPPSAGSPGSGRMILAEIDPLLASGRLPDAARRSLVAATAALKDTVVEYVVRARSGDLLLTHQVWVGVNSAAALVEMGGSAQFTAVRPAFVPVLLLDLLRVGPRPHLPTGADGVTARMLSEFVESGRFGTPPVSASRTVVDEMLKSGRIRAAVLEARWPRGAPTETRVALLDTPAGILAVQDDPDVDQELVATSPSALWRALVRMLRPAPPG
ncbi:MAG TPA: hypothetical protein VHO29_20500 [Marmoricola sp.]|nr:hypothetical protein [Marmoricola sp.]